MGIGSANNNYNYYTDIRVFGDGIQSESVNDYDFIAWPSSGAVNIAESFYESCDKRVKHVRLTSKGKDICKHAYNGMLKREEWFLSSLDNEEKKELQRLLQKIYDNTSNDKSYSRQTTANH